MAWRAHNPEVELEGAEAERRHLHAALDAGALDLAILQGSLRCPGISRASLWSERILAALPASHPLATKETLQWSHLREETFMLTATDPGPDIRDMLLGRFARDGWRPNIKMRNISRESIMSLLGAGSAISVTYEGASGTPIPMSCSARYWGHTASHSCIIPPIGVSITTIRRCVPFLGFMRRRCSLTIDIS